jgi:hypothetical protein
VTSERKIRANRANARASTGPKTTHGRSHAARNALRHALSLPVYFDPALSAEVEALTRKIAGTDANAEQQQRARPIAEAQIDLRRVRYARHQLLSHALSDPDYESDGMLRKKAALAIRCLRRIGPFSPMPDNVMEVLNSKPEGPCKSQRSSPTRLVSCSRLTAMNGALPTQIRHSSLRCGTLSAGCVLTNAISLAGVLRKTQGWRFWQNEAKKLNLFREPVTAQLAQTTIGHKWWPLW